MFSNEGAIVHFTYLNDTEELETFMNEVSKKNLPIYPHKVDSTNEAAVKEFVGSLEKIDVLINNSGIISDQLIPLMEEQQWLKVLDVNLNGYFYYLKNVSKRMIENRNGSIINIASISGMKGIKGQGNYSAAKAGVISLTRTLSVELAAKKIRVNAIAPGYIETDMIQALNDKMMKECLLKIPLKRFGKVEDVANLALFLASDESSYITGQCIILDGGCSVL